MATTNTLGASDVDLLRQAVQLAKAGRKDEARTYLAESCLINPYNEKAWLWRASLAPSTEDAIAWLERVLELNPENQTAHNWMQRLRPAPEPESAAPAAPPQTEPAEAAWTCPFCSFESPRQLTRCPDCQGVTKLDLDAIDANSGANERQIKYAAEHYAQMLASGEPVYGYYQALACLNIHRSYDAHVALKRYFLLHSDDEEVRHAIAKLGARKLVLAVDDSPTVRSVVSDALERAHYRCATACNGVDAVGFIEREALPDFVLMDVSMPVMDGYQLCKTIKQMPTAKNVPVVMLSGNDGFVDKVKGRMAGASDYLLKPFNADTLLAVLRRLTVQGNK